MHAFHSNWTKPFFKKYPNRKYEVEDFELLTTIISALKWQEVNGDIEMITDKRGAQYYKEIGLSSLWNKGIDESLEEMDYWLDESTFWAAGKLYALAKQKSPCLMLDTDFIIWENVRDELQQHDVTVIHKELLDTSVYPNGEAFQLAKDYAFPKDWDWQEQACNTAFAYFHDIAFKDYYVKEAFRFMKATHGTDPLIYMVFAEQRLLAMCAKEKQADLRVLATTDELFNGHQTKYTHVWGYKKYLQAHPEARWSFCKRCVARIQRDFPHFYPVLFEIEALKAYL